MKVLAVDDNASLLRFLVSAFTANGCAVTPAPTAEQALELIAREAFDLVVSDIKMPGLTGLDLLRAVKGLQPATPVVRITGAPSVNSAVFGLRHQIVVKPAGPRTVLCREHLGLRRNGAAERGQQIGAAFHTDQPVADHALEAVRDFLVLEVHQPLGVRAERAARIGRECARLEHAQRCDRETFGARDDKLGIRIEIFPRRTRASIEQHRGDREIEFGARLRGG